MLAVCLFDLSCFHKRSGVKKDVIITEKDIIPEGLAYDAGSQTVYVSSTWKRKILAIDQEGHVSDFIRAEQYGVKSIIGMEVDRKRNCLWAVSSQARDVLPLMHADSLQWRSSVYQFNLPDGALIKEYPLNRDSVFLNDLTVGPGGKLYVTESLQGGIFILEPESEDSLSLFLQAPPYTFLNGICFAGSQGNLYVSSTEGIISVNPDTKQYGLLPTAPGVDARSIDGLSFYHGYFIAHQSKRIARLYFSAMEDSLVVADILDSGPEFDSSTTGELAEGAYWYIVNSQIRSGIDAGSGTVKPIDSLENIIIRKIIL